MIADAIIYLCTIPTGMVHEQERTWDKAYLSNESYFGEMPSIFGVRSADDFKMNGKVNILELGAGQGRDTRYFLEKGLNLIVMDFSDIACAQLRHNFGDRITVVKRDISKGIDMPDSSVDGCYGHMILTMDFTDDELRSIIADVHRVLVPGGLFIFSVRNTNDSDYGVGEKVRDFVYKNQKGFNVRFFDKNGITSFLDDFDIVRINEFSEGTKVLYGITVRKLTDQ